MRFERQVRARLEAAGAAGCLVVAVSGGADSTAALLALHALVARSELPARLIACHVDHGLRPAAERAAELALLEQLTGRLAIELIVRHVDVAGARSRGRSSLEAAARRVRYTALGAVAIETGAAGVVTGHTADDQVETLLLRLLRGTGIAGLRGMSAASNYWTERTERTESTAQHEPGDGEPLLLRPLLGATRAETERYCRVRDACWAQDSSNDELRFRRNRIRQELLPLLRAIAPGAPAALLRLAAQAGVLDDWVEDEARRVLGEVWSTAGAQRLLARPAPALHPALRAAVVRAALLELIGPPGPPSQRHVSALMDLWIGPGGRRLAIGHGWRAVAESAGVRFTRTGSQSLTDRGSPDTVSG